MERCCGWRDGEEFLVVWRVNGNLIGWKYLRELPGVAVVVGGRGTMAGWSVGFDLLHPCPSSLFWPTVLTLLLQP